MLKRTKKKLKRTRHKTALKTTLDEPVRCEACFIKTRQKGKKYVPDLIEDSNGLIFCNKCRRLVHFGINQKLLKPVGNGRI